MKSLSPSRRAFNAWELLVVVCVVLLVLLLLPMWTNTGVRHGRANTCRNNLRNLALAVAQYDNSRGHFPGYCEDLDGTDAASPNDERSWVFVVLPYLEHRSLYDRVRIDGVSNADIKESLEIGICPSLPAGPSSPAAFSYAANTGLLDGQPRSGPSPLGHSYDFAGNGVFHNRAAPAVPDTPIVTVSYKYISESDGLGTTLMLSENVDAARWTGGPTIGGGIRPSERWMGFTWHHADGQPGIPALVESESLGINVRAGESQNTNPARGFARPSSHHPSGMNMAFCDSRVKYISDGISYGVYQAMMTPRGRDAMYTLNAADDVAPQPLPENHAARKIVDEADIR